jgi:hypothetical protein
LGVWNPEILEFALIKKASHAPRAITEAMTLGWIHMKLDSPIRITSTRIVLTGKTRRNPRTANLAKALETLNSSQTNKAQINTPVMTSSVSPTIF